MTALTAMQCTKIYSNLGSQVYLVRFVVSPDDNADFGSQHGLGQEYEEFEEYDYERNSKHGHKPTPLNKTGGKGKRPPASPGISMETEFPESVSIATLLNAGKLIKPKAQRDVELKCELFDVVTAPWEEAMTVKCSLVTEKVSSGGFRNAYHASISSMPTGEDHWFVKTYNDKAVKSFLLFFQPRLFLFALDRYLIFLHFLTFFLDFIFFQF